MRTNKELVELTLEYAMSEGPNHPGLCSFSRGLYFIGVISVEEHYRLIEIIEKNKPNEPYSEFYHFKPFNWDARIDYLTKILTEL